MDRSYIEMMIESFDKKKTLLNLLIDKTEAQKEIFNEGSEPDWDAFTVLTDEKEGLINDLNELDNGFENLYNRVKDELQANTDKYKEEIAKMQKLIGEVTDLSTKLEAMEKRNKNLIESGMATSRQSVRTGKVSTKVALSYYNGMNKINNVDPQLMDKKS